MKMFLISIILGIALPVMSDESYQATFVIGNWKTLDGIFSLSNLEITKSSPDKMLLRYCEPRDLEVTGGCKENLSYFGDATYAPSLDSMLVKETSSSPTPMYYIEVDRQNSNLLNRIWRNQVITYYKMPKNLLNKATYIGGDIKNPTNPFIKCVAKTALKAVYGNEGVVLFYLGSAGVDTNTPPEKISFKFISENKNGSREIFQAFLTSSAAQKWQYVKGSTGEISFYSEKVSSEVGLYMKDGITKVLDFDISSCQ